jgi:organic hydroperoxide reductase OsmC/OhrA
MQDLPHHYRCVATANADQSQVRVASQGLEDLTTDAPKEFGGPGDQWSPEALLVAAVADCFVLTFRAMAGPSQITWHALDCDATGTLERVDRSTAIHPH